MSESREVTTAATDDPPAGLIVLGTPDGATDAGDCADGFCAL
ncbi:hypothetical protein [Jiangella rhizosphaerae]|nr:hypothetical protein [Jiangella rhizosphaerae]